MTRDASVRTTVSKLVGVWLISLLAACDIVAGIREGQPQCLFDGTINGLETGIDCGGPCAACSAGQSCDEPGDCASGVCDEGQCAAPNCFDGVRNGDESDVDCGGSTLFCRRCLGGERCTSPDDCASSPLSLDPGMLPACLPDAPGGDVGVCRPNCCSNDCAGCEQLCLGACCEQPEGCCDPSRICEAPGSGVLVYGEPCNPVANLCAFPLQCLAGMAATFSCQ